MELLWFFVGYEIIRAIKKRGDFYINIFILPPPFIYFLLINYYLLLLLEVISRVLFIIIITDSWKSCIVVIEIYFRTVSLENVFEEKARKQAINQESMQLTIHSLFFSF